MQELIKKEDNAIKSKKEKIKQLKPTDSVKVDAQKYMETVVLAADKMDPKTLAKENEKMKEWLKQNDVEVNFSDLKPNDEAGKAKRLVQILKDNPHLASNADFLVTKKELDQVCKFNNTQLDTLVTLDEGLKYQPNQEVAIEATKIIDSLLTSEKVDKKLMAKNSKKMQEYLEKNNIEVDLTGVKEGDEEGKLKVLKKLIQNNAASLQGDFTLTKKDLDEICRTTKTGMQELIKKEDNAIKSKKEKIKQLKPTDSVKVDAQKYMETVVLAADKMDPKTLAKENEKMKEWLKQNDVEVNFSDLKPNDEAGKAKRLVQILKDNPHLASNADFLVTKKELDQVCKFNNTQLDTLVTLDEGLKYQPNQEVAIEATKIIDSLLTSEKVDKKLMAKNSKKMQEYLEKNNIEVDLTGVKEGDEEGKLKVLKKLIQNNAASLQGDFTLTKKDLDEICRTTKTGMQELIKKEDNAIKSKKEKIKQLKPTDSVKVDAQKYMETVVLAADKMDPEDFGEGKREDEGMAEAERR